MGKLAVDVSKMAENVPLVASDKFDCFQICHLCTMSNM